MKEEIVGKHIIEKEEYCEKYFENKIKPKHLKMFKTTTPQKNEITGFICKKANRYLGSLVITGVNGENVEQFVHGFPKIHYWDKYHQISNSCHAYEKLDGSCIGVYALQNQYGDVIEIIPKSRNMPVADENLVSMYELCDLGSIKQYFKFKGRKNDVLFFELYGIKNHHSIKHYTTYIDLALIGIYEYKFTFKDEEIYDFASNNNIYYIAKANGFKTPNLLFEINKERNTNNYELFIHDLILNKYRYYLPKDICQKVTVPTIYDGILEIKELLEKLNESYKKENGYILTEGVVLNGLNEKYNQLYIKVKPPSIEESARKEGLIENGISRKFIIKEIYKFFDEHESKAKELYINKPQYIWNYVQTNLKEEFDNDLVENPKTLKRIKKVFLDVANSREVPESINNIAIDLVKRYPQEDIGNLMRIYASENPYRKKESRLVYGVLEKLLVKK